MKITFSANPSPVLVVVLLDERKTVAGGEGRIRRRRLRIYLVLRSLSLHPPPASLFFRRIGNPPPTPGFPTLRMLAALGTRGRENENAKKERERGENILPIMHLPEG